MLVVTDRNRKPKLAYARRNGRCRKGLSWSSYFKLVAKRSQFSHEQRNSAWTLHLVFTQEIGEQLSPDSKLEVTSQGD